MAPPGFCNGGSEVWVYRGSRVRSPLVPVVLSVYQRGSLLDGLVICICRVIRRSSMTVKAHTYYIIFGHPPIGGSFPLPSLVAPLVSAKDKAAQCDTDSRPIANSYTYYYYFSITHSLLHSRLKTFLFCKSFPLQPFFFFFRTDYMYVIPQTFTVTSD